MTRPGMVEARPGFGVTPPFGLRPQNPQVENDPPIRWFSFLALSLAIMALLFVAFPYDVRQSQREQTSVDAQLTDVSSLVEKGTPARQISLLTLGAIALVAFFRRSENRLRLNRWPGLAGMALLAWMALSIGWSDDPFLSLKRVTAAFIMCALALALARGFSRRELLLFSVGTLGLAVAIGVISELWLGTFKPLDPSYRFGGELHPNVMTYHCSLLILVLLAWAHEVPRLRWAWWGTALLAGVFMILTKSRTGLAAWMVAMAVVAAISTPRATKLVWLAILGCVVSGLIIVDPELVSALGRALLLGRADSDPNTLTGRTDLWMGLWNIGMQRPWTGFGYGAFWSWGRILEVLQVSNWLPGQAHSTLLEVTLNLGVVGLVAYMLLHLGALVRALRDALAKRGDPFSLFVVAVLVNMHMNSLTETVLFRENLACLIFLIVVARLAYMESPTGGTRPRTAGPVVPNHLRGLGRNRTLSGIVQISQVSKQQPSRPLDWDRPRSPL